MTAEAAEAPAKVNLHLHVTGRRPDGYHLLDSLVAFADHGDTVEVRPGRGLSLRVEGPMAADLAGEGDNLVLRAARALAEGLGRPADLSIRLVKRLPVASGIGGGSADAAATLRAVGRLWGLDAEDPLPMRIAPSLGADVPVCLAGTPCNMGGIGDDLSPAPDLPPAWLVLVNPRVPCPTPAVFRARVGPFTPADPLLRPVATAEDLAVELGRRRNDLTAAALTVAPEITRVLARLSACPGCLLARMSGSGATCFGLFADATAAEAAAAEIAAAEPAWWAVPAPLIGRGRRGR